MGWGGGVDREREGRIQGRKGRERKEEGVKEGEG